MRRWKMLLPMLLGALMVMGTASCDGPKPKKKPVVKKKKRRKRPPPRRVAAAPRVKKKKFRTVELTDQDFVETPSNRDPFRSYMAEFQQPGERRQLIVQRRVLLKRYALDELKLIAVITGGVRAKAMFRDPSGLGVTIKRGDYLSKSNGRVKQILPGKVVVEIKESYEGGQKIADRVIELHSKTARR